MCDCFAWLITCLRESILLLSLSLVLLIINYYYYYYNYNFIKVSNHVAWEKLKLIKGHRLIQT